MEADQVELCLRLLGLAKRLPADHPDRRKVEHAATGLLRDGRHHRRAAARAEDVRADGGLLASTVTGAADRRMDAPLPAPSPAPEAAFLPGSLHRPVRCYICRDLYQRVHHFYHRLCPDCAIRNFARRTARADLIGRKALVTGGRVKIGHQLALMLLRDGAEVMVTTRFPADAVRRFSTVPGAESWWERLTVAGIDLRDPRQVVALTDRLLADHVALDILVNNAAQTLWRPAGSYAALAAGEVSSPGRSAIWTAPGFVPPGSDLPRTEPAGDLTSGLTSGLAAGGRDGLAKAGGRDDLTGGLVIADEAGLLPDPSPANSWSMRLGEVDPVELLEAQLVNAVAPFLLADRLLPLLLASPHPRRYVVNVSAVEGQFAVGHKTGGHPHTNMAKAALNMLTRTSAGELAARRVYMCSVDTGWITDEHPLPERARRAESGWRPPLDVVDGAARIYDPIVRGEAGEPVHGVLLKDYGQVPW